MLSAQSYLELVRSRGERRLELSRIYRNIQRKDLFLLAYQNLYANQGATTPGTDPTDTIDGMSLAKVEKVIQSLEQGTFTWKPARRVYIDKANGQKRPLGIPMVRAYCTSFKGCCELARKHGNKRPGSSGASVKGEPASQVFVYTNCWRQRIHFVYW